LTDTFQPGPDAEPIDDAPLDDRHSDKATVRRVVWFVAAIVVLLLLRTFVAEPVRVRGDSMEPTLPPGAVLVIDKATFHARDPHRGDVVVASDPRNGASIVKRVVATGGDSVGIDDGVLIVNDVPVVENYIDNHDMDGYYFGPDKVPAGNVFLLGDNRADSVDSRAFGPVPIDSINGRVLMKIWPIG